MPLTLTGVLLRVGFIYKDIILKLCKIYNKMNTQLIAHISTELVVIGGITLFFMQKHKKFS